MRSRVPVQPNHPAAAAWARTPGASIRPPPWCVHCRLLPACSRWAALLCADAHFGP